MSIENVEPFKEVAKPDPQTTAKLHDEAVIYELARGGGGGGGHGGGGGGHGGGGFPHPGGGGGHGGGGFPHPGGGGGHGGGGFPHPGGGGGHGGDGGFPHPGGSGGGGFPRPGGGGDHPMPHPGGGGGGHPFPRPEPHPGPGPHPHPPDHGFPPGHGGWGPPENRQWGWHDEARWARGWDPWFWMQSPNYNTWGRNIENEAASVAFHMDQGNLQGAATELSQDLYAMRGDMYAQDQLLSEVNRFDRKGLGADIYMSNWDPARGTWDNIQLYEPGIGSIPINTYGGYYDQWPIALGGMIER